MSLLWATSAGQVRDADGRLVDPEVHYISHRELADMYSGDYDVKMHKAKAAAQEEWDEAGSYPGGEEDRAETAHSGQVAHGGPTNYVEHLKGKIRDAGGIHEPLTIRGGNVVVDGNHRGMAAIELRLPRIPVRHQR